MIRLLSSDFTKMVLIAIIIAVPFSVWILRGWLDNFAYRIELSWIYFAGAALITLLVAWTTVGLQTLKAVKLNPVNCLRDE